MNEDWLRVFEHELSRRRRIHAENPSLFKTLHQGNPKGLLHKEDCKEHCWVPATHLMIQDGGSKSYVIKGMRRRGFREAFPYKLNGEQVVPQICWECDATRDLGVDLTSAEERLVKLKASRPRKSRGRHTERAESIFDELFG